MSKYELVEKIKIKDLIRSWLLKTPPQPHQLLKESILNFNNKNIYYFNWGRNALFYLFKKLKYRQIVFPAFTCPTLTQAAEKAGKKVVLADIDINTFNIDINKIPKSAACLLVVHTFGNPVDINKIRKRYPNIYIIEDCAHSFYAKVRDKYTGNFGNDILFSLYKQIPNINGSLLFTNKTLKAGRARELDFKYLNRLFFKLNGPHQFFLNFQKQRYLPEIQEFKLTKKTPSSLSFSLFYLSYLNLLSEIKKRNKIANWYYKLAAKSSFLIAQIPEKTSCSSFYQFAVRLRPEHQDIREKLVLNLRKSNIFIDRLWFQAPIADKKYQQFVKYCPNSYLLAKTIINLPIYSSYSLSEAEFLFAQINKQIKRLI
jgi:dTDP-4-amino-4,6-dideoxygalactose transaminase